VPVVSCIKPFNHILPLIVKHASLLDRYDWARARKIWEDTQDADRAIQAFPKKANLEIGVLKKLKQNPTDFSGAFSSVSTIGMLRAAEHRAKHFFHRRFHEI
jgi:tRNA pseudouridine synthase D (TruD)